MTVVQRNRKETRANIIAALGRLLARSGFRQIGVNAVAREAGVDKVLIYRYFGGMPELLKAFAEESDFWPGAAELISECGDSWAELTIAERAKQLLVAFGRAIRKRPLTQEILRWELQERNDLTDTLARYREAQSAMLIEDFAQASGVDVQAVGSLLAAGQTYLVLRAHTTDVYNGLSLNSDQDWTRVEAAICLLIDAVLAAPTRDRVARPGSSRTTRRNRRKQKDN